MSLSNNTLNFLNRQLDHLKLQTFQILTGNINNYATLKFKRYNNSADELSACLDLQFSKLPDDAIINSDGVLMLSENKSALDHLYQTSNDYDRDDLKITLKVFLDEFNIKNITDSVDSVLKQLHTQNVEQLIVAFPARQDDNSPSWMNSVFEIWRDIETQLVTTGKVLCMGVSDFSLEDISSLYKHATIKPSVLHFNIEGCCVVPPELQKFATENDIQLLTHNDPYPFPLGSLFHQFCNVSNPSAICAFKPIWAARYTVWVRRRSLMAGKGYILQFSSH